MLKLILSVVTLLIEVIACQIRHVRELAASVCNGPVQAGILPVMLSSRTNLPEAQYPNVWALFLSTRTFTCVISNVRCFTSTASLAEELGMWASNSLKRSMLSPLSHTVISGTPSALMKYQRQCSSRPDAIFSNVLCVADANRCLNPKSSTIVPTSAFPTNPPFGSALRCLC